MKTKHLILYLIISIILFACNNIQDEKVDTIDLVKINNNNELIADLINLDHTPEENCFKDYNDTLYKVLRKKSQDIIEMNVERDSSYFFNHLIRRKWKINMIRYLDTNGNRVEYFGQKDSLIFIFFDKDWNIYDIDKNIIGNWDIETYDGLYYDVEVIGLRFDKKIIAPIVKFEYYDFVYFYEEGKIFHLENMKIYRKYVFAGVEKRPNH